MQEEIFPLVDEQGNVIGQATRSQCHSGSKLLHPVIHLHVFNEAGKLYMQKRSATKDIQPNKWDSSVGGHIDLNETPQQAALREAGEEIGLKDLTIHYIDKYIIETDRERELTYCFYTKTNQIPKVDMKEVSDGRFWDISEINEQLGKNIFTPNFELDFGHFLSKGFDHLNNTK
ncbi:NUDIX hydrolase [Dysgonomonas sp. HGC4]|uniref:NUDIX hydrolase n=1 Tax=Dysgonomonas sp. HGC4 TaxID=1658009 RepID=UPI00067FD609|nr:NUDIX domain-containing protein [Dysgonomonas sp. HGC4]MBD8348754.1 NUDIX domain-containing protein [Dysgonomonas sp. HGC4]